MTIENIVSIGNYGNYTGNYGAHCQRVTLGALDLYFSYQTIVAFRDPAAGLVCVENIYSNTTGKHLNAIQPDKKRRVPLAEFEAKLKATLARYELIRKEAAANV